MNKLFVFVLFTALCTISCNKDCEEDTTCENGFGAEDDSGDCFCDCAPGWVGETCSDPIDCSEEITCVNGEAAFIDTTCGCVCETGYYGDTCSLAYAVDYISTTWEAKESCNASTDTMVTSFVIEAATEPNEVIINPIASNMDDAYKATFIVLAKEVSWSQQDLGNGMTLYAGSAPILSTTIPRVISIGYTIVDADGVEMTCKGRWTEQ